LSMLPRAGYRSKDTGMSLLPAAATTLPWGWL
jgi:hypothetical protein